jgi:hypothetical protein
MGDYKKEFPYADTEGVPRCRCEKHPPMKLVEAEGFYTAERRAREDIPRGARRRTA